MREQRLENIILLCLALAFVLAIWVILYHPEWLLWLLVTIGK